jgi:hypothetical protein
MGSFITFCFFKKGLDLFSGRFLGTLFLLIYKTSTGGKVSAVYKSGFFSLGFVGI